MKNPLRKRLLRDLKNEIGKYIVIFLLLVALISFVSGFLVADGSMKHTYEESFEKYNIEDGYFDVEEALSNNQIERIEKHGITLYPNYFTEEKMTNKSTLRIFATRKQVDKVCVMKGELPAQTGEIAIDRMYADNNHIKIGDMIKSTDKQWKVTGYVALSDYSSLFSDNNDTMFDAVKFGVAVVGEDEFEKYTKDSLSYRYSWLYHDNPVTQKQEHDKAEELMKKIAGEVTLESFVPQYQNQAICFTGDDMGSDKSMMMILLYIVILILAFVFGITISNTISKESTTIGTLRALGYRRQELVRHYLILPLCVTVIGAIVGNALGYTVLEQVVQNMYYGSYSLTQYQTMMSGEAFLITTVVPFFIMILINWSILSYKLTLSPLQLIRKDLRRKSQKHALRLAKWIPFFTRFRFRIVLQNGSNYFMLLIGIVFANLLLLFGMGLPVVLDHYQEDIQNNLLSSYQYMLKVPPSLMSEDSDMSTMMMALQFYLGTKTENETAEAFSAYSLNTTDDICDSEEILLYGIVQGSKYISASLPSDGVYISSAYADKYLLKTGDTITLKEKYKNKKYQFKVSGIYEYNGSLVVFMPKSKLNETFDLGSDYTSGYFSNSPITDIDDKYIGTVINLESLTKVSRQLDVSMGSMMYLVDAFAILIFIVLIYLLSKLVIEKNANSISMTKILGYSNLEIGKLYIMATSFVVVISLLLSMVLDYYLMLWIFRQMMLSSMSGWIRFQIDNSLFISMFIIGIVTYMVVAAVEFCRIKRVPMDEALKNDE